MKLHPGVLLLVVGVVLGGSTAWSAPNRLPLAGLPPESGQPVGPPLPVGCTASLHFARSKVASGGIDNPAHQSDFWIEVRDGNGQPRSGVAVNLPLITRGGDAPKSSDAKSPPRESAHLEWLPTTARVSKDPSQATFALALTGKDGRAYGRFTSGPFSQKVEFSGVGGGKASLEQVWNEDRVPWNHPPFMNMNGPSLVRYEMSFKEGDQQTMINGHDLRLVLESVEFEAFPLSGLFDEQGIPQSLDVQETFTVSAPASESPLYADQKALWDTVMSWCVLDGMHETAPGIYEGHYQVVLPPKPIFLGAYQIDSVNMVHYAVVDENAFVDTH